MGNLEVLHPSQMHVEFALFQQDKLLRRGSLLITPEKGFSCFGEQVELTAARANGEQVVAQAFSGLIVEHEFGLPAASLSLRYVEVIPAADSDRSYIQAERFAAALQMGVHYSEDWETIALNGFDFAFRCEPL